MALTKITSNVIESGSIAHSSLADSGVTAGTHGHAAGIPVLEISSKGIITGVNVVDVAGVSNVTYNNVTGILTVSTSDGSNFNVDLSVGSQDSLELTSLSASGSITADKILYSNVYSTEGELPDAATYHGMFAHVHGTGKGYFSHAGAWHKLIDETSSDTDDLSEGSTNQYFTTARARASVSATGSLSYNQSTGVFSFTQGDTDTVSEGSTNLYYTDTRVRSVLTADSIANTTYVDQAEADAISTAAADATSKANAALASANSYTDAEVAALVDSSPATLDTLNELAAALGDDPNFATTTATNIGTKANKTITVSAGSGLTGGGDLTANRTISHADTSSQASVNNSNGTVIQDITLDTYGHLTGITSYNLDDRYYTESEADSRFVNVTGDTITGTLTLSQDGQDVLNFSANDTNDRRGISFNSRTALSADYNDGYLRLNDASEFSNGVFTPGVMRADGGFNINGSVVFHDGYHPNADKWTTSRTLSLTGDASGSTSWDGSGNASLSVTVADDSHSHKIIKTSGNYVWNNSTTAGNYATIDGAPGIQTSFVRAANGWPDYGAVLHVGARGGSDAGGDFQLFCGHGSSNGGNYLRVRNADNSASPTDSWTSWRTIWDSGNDGSGSGLDADLLDGVQGSSYLRSDADDTVTGQITFPGNIGSRPVFSNGILARSDQSDTEGTHDIWGISERYYPSNPTAGDAWGIQWGGSPNEINFIGAGQKKFSVDLDTAGNIYMNTSGGNVGIGDATPSYKLDVNGTIRATGDLLSDSDIRLKSEIKPITNAVDTVKSLRGASYIKDDKPNIGLIAQEVEEVMPFMVSTASDEMGTKSVNYQNMVALLIEAMKEQQEQIDELKAQLNS